MCADQWDKHDADVACRMMYYDGSLSAFSKKLGPTKPARHGSIKCSVQETKVLSSRVNMVLWELMAARIKLVLYVDQKVK